MFVEHIFTYRKEKAVFFLLFEENYPDDDVFWSPNFDLDDVKIPLW